MSVDRPQYGEYATPEEQRARAGLPPLDAPVPASAPPSILSGSRPSAPAAAGSPAGSAGRLITFVLLGFGLFHVLSSIPGLLDLTTTLNQSLTILGLEGEFTNFSAARLWGAIAAVVLVAGYVGTAVLALRMLRRGRAAWWIPLVGAVVTTVLVSLCISVPMFGDPAFTQGLLAPTSR